MNLNNRFARFFFPLLRRARARATNYKSQLDFTKTELDVARIYFEDKIRRLEVERDKARAESYRDPLTGLLNKRGLEVAYHVPHLKAPRVRLVTVVAVDLDGFKKLNDTEGHLKGDLALRRIAITMPNIFQRDQDILVRSGGDEFIIVLPEKEEAMSMTLSERFKQQEDSVMELCKRLLHDIAACSEGKLSASIGFTVGIMEKGKLNLLLERADQAMYKAKRRGGKGIVPFRDICTAA
jgi:diguanylate cyclase (GGDEF)-like protein